jgi:hypothetical protein
LAGVTATAVAKVIYFVLLAGIIPVVIPAMVITPPELVKVNPSALLYKDVPPLLKSPSSSTSNLNPVLLQVDAGLISNEKVPVKGSIGHFPFAGYSAC